MGEVIPKVAGWWATAEQTIVKEDRLYEAFRAIESILGGGSLGLSARDLVTGQTLRYNADWTFPTASVIKAPIVAELHVQAVEGRLSLDERITVRAEDIVGGSGVLSHLALGHTFTLSELAQLAIMVSDNTASNLVLRAVGGPSVVNRRMQDEWGMTQTTIHRPIQFHLEPNDPPYTATGTPDDMATFMASIAEGTLHSAAVCDAMKAVLATTNDTSMLPRYMEINPYSDDLRVVRPYYTVLHKPGAVTGVRNDAGIIRRDTPPYGHIAIAVYTKGVADTRWTTANTGCEAVSRAAKLVCHLFWGGREHISRWDEWAGFDKLL